MDIGFPLMPAEAKRQQFASHFPTSSFPISHFLIPTFRVTPSPPPGIGHACLVPRTIFLMGCEKKSWFGDKTGVW